MVQEEGARGKEEGTSVSEKDRKSSVVEPRACVPSTSGNSLEVASGVLHLGESISAFFFLFPVEGKSNDKALSWQEPCTRQDNTMHCTT